MDPKLSNLDPKLQDAYHRVMGTSHGGNNPPQTTLTPPPQDPAMAPPPASTDLTSQAFGQSPQAAPPPAPAQVQEPPPPPTPVEPSRPIESAPSNLPPGSIPGVNSTLAFNSEDSHKNVGTTPTKKKGSHLMPVFVGLGIVALLVVYTFVWIILFNVQVPFLPQL